MSRGCNESQLPKAEHERLLSPISHVRNNGEGYGGNKLQKKEYVAQICCGLLAKPQGPWGGGTPSLILDVVFCKVVISQETPRSCVFQYFSRIRRVNWRLCLSLMMLFTYAKGPTSCNRQIALRRQQSQRSTLTLVTCPRITFFPRLLASTQRRGSVSGNLVD